MTLIEMEGFLRGKCLPGDMLVNETNAQYLHRKLTAYEATVTNLTAQVQGLAAEMEKYRNAHPQPFGREMMKALDAYEKHQDDVPETGMLNAFFILRDSICVDTEATDAELAEMRAQGVDLAIEHLTKKFEGTGGVGVPVMALDHLASELRKEQGK